MSGIRGERVLNEDGSIKLTGGLKCAETNRQRYGKDWYSKIGAIGGRVGHTGGFASSVVGPDGLTGWQRAKIAGSKGGRISRRNGVKNGDGKRHQKEDEFVESILES